MNRALHPHGHDYTSYDILHCCLCSPESKTARHDPVEENGVIVCRRCGKQIEHRQGQPTT
jgi:hypothetical protein